MSLDLQPLNSMYANSDLNQYFHADRLGYGQAVFKIFMITFMIRLIYGMSIKHNPLRISNITVISFSVSRYDPDGHK